MNSPEQDTLLPARPLIVTIFAVLTLVGTVLYFGYILLKWLVPELDAQEVELPGWLVTGIYVLQGGKFAAAILLLGMRKLGFYLYAGLEFLSAVGAIISSKIALDYMDTSYVNPSITFDPAILVYGTMAFSVGLSIMFIWGFAAHLGKMR